MTNYEGMTVNERLFAASVLSDFDMAVKNRDRLAMVKLLVRVGLTEGQAQLTSDTILLTPKKYGYADN